MFLNPTKAGVIRLNLGNVMLQRAKIQTTASHLKGNQRRPIPAGGVTAAVFGKATSHRESVAKVISAAARAKWEAENAELERLSGLVPSTSIYFASNFERQKFNFISVVEMLRESAVPEIYDCLQNPLVARIVLNMRTKKTTKFISKYEVEVLLPHSLDFLPKRRIIAICSDPAQIEECLAVGACAAGGNDVISRLGQGGFHWDEYDDVVIHPDFIDSVNSLRKMLRNRFPTLKNKRVDANVAALVSTYQNTIIVGSTSIEGIPEVAHIDVVLGQLSWTNERLMENLISYLQVLSESKSNRIHGELLTDVSLKCLPCDEMFYLDLVPLLTSIVPSRQTKQVGDESPHDDSEDAETDSMSI